MMTLLVRVIRRLLLLAERQLVSSGGSHLPLATHGSLPKNGLDADQVRQQLLDLDVEGRDYLELHIERLVHTLTRIPVAAREDAEVLELGSYSHFSVILASALRYRVRGAYLGPQGRTDHRLITARGRTLATVSVDLFDAERDTWPYEADRFDGLLVCEVIEHLRRDPLWMLWEANRVLRTGGWILVTTPNCASFRSLERVLLGQENPQVFSRYNSRDLDDPPHVREYTPRELEAVLTAAGFAVSGMETTREPGALAPGWAGDILAAYGFPEHHRGEQIYCLATKESVPRDRFPALLYT